MGTKGKATTSSTVKNVSNSGQMSTSSQKTGATGGVVNKTTIVSQGANGTPGTVNTPYPPSHVESDLIKYYRSLFGI